MRLCNFLTEKYNYIKNVTKILQTKCKNNLKLTLDNEPILFRGDKELIEDTYIFKKSKRPNISNTSYMHVLNNLPSWQNIPKRTESLMCSTHNYTANDYGHVYVVIPYDDAKIIKSPIYDFWYILTTNELLTSLRISFSNNEFTKLCIPPKAKISSQFLNLTLSELVNIYWSNTDKLANSSIVRNIYLGAGYKKLNKPTLSIIDSTKENTLIYLNTTKILQNTKLIDIYEYYFNPTALKLETVSYSKLFNTFKNHECWTDSSCILMYHAYYTSHIKELKELIR